MPSKVQLKGELQCKTSQKGVKEGPKTRVSSVLVCKVKFRTKGIKKGQTILATNMYEK